jgi:hypothetical protein
MANDIKLADDAEPIKNGTLVVYTKVTGPTDKDKLNTYVINTPAIGDIEDKYDNRFDDPSYYYGA